MHASRERSGLILVGAGPAGLAPLFAAANTGQLDALLLRGLMILERSQTLGSGSLGRYAIRSDSSSEALLDIVLRSRDPRLASLRSHPAMRAVAQSGDRSTALKAVGEFLEVASGVLCDAVASSDRGRVIREATAQWVQKTARNTWLVRYADGDGSTHEIEADNVLLATGASQPLVRLETELVAGVPLLPTYDGKLMQSDEVLRQDGLSRISALLQGKRNPKIAIVGGSTSAAAVALQLLTRLRDVQFSKGSITLLHRKPLRLFYETRESALRDGYTEFSPEDICPLTGRIFRLSGFRLDSRELVMQLRGIAGRPPEPRVRLLQLESHQQAEARACLDEADLVIAALGYQPKLLPIFDQAMRPIALRQPGPDSWARVDPQSRLLSAQELPLEGLFAVGLAMGPAASSELGGEVGFRGQVNSLWLWQHTVGQNIVRQLLERPLDKHSEAKTLSRLLPRTVAMSEPVRMQSAQTHAVGVS